MGAEFLSLFSPRSRPGLQGSRRRTGNKGPLALRPHIARLPCHGGEAALRRVGSGPPFQPRRLAPAAAPDRREGHRHGRHPLQPAAQAHRGAQNPMQTPHSPRGTSLVGVLAIACLVVAGATGCLKRTGGAESGTGVPTRHVRVPAQWTDITYCCAISFDEFVATGDFESWAEWCEANGMTAGPHRVKVSRCPRLLFLRAGSSYDYETCQRLELRQSESLPSGAGKASWFDPETRRVIFQQGFW